MGNGHRSAWLWPQMGEGVSSVCRHVVCPEQGEASPSRRSQEPLRSWRTEPEPGSWCPVLPKRGAEGRVLDRQADEWAHSWQGYSRGLLQLAEHPGSAASLPADQAPGTHTQRTLTRLGRGWGGGLDWWAVPGPAPRQRVLLGRRGHEDLEEALCREEGAIARLGRQEETRPSDGTSSRSPE